MQAFMLSFKEQFRYMFVPTHKNTPKYQILGSSIMAGGTAGCCALTIIYPLDFTRTLLAVDMSQKSFIFLAKKKKNKIKKNKKNCFIFFVCNKY